jgi:hypothetical protein
MYTLTFTEKETNSIWWVGHRYCWSAALQKLLSFEDDGTPEKLSLEEHEAWELVSQFEADTEGGHSFFPCLDHASPLAGKLFAFMESIV